MKKKSSKKKIISKKKFIQQSLFEKPKNHYINEPIILKSEKKDKLNITHWNVNGIRAVLRKNNLAQYLEKKNFDIICLSETKCDFKALKQENLNEKELWYKKYHQYWHFSSFKRGYSGCVIFSKIKPLKSFFGINEEKFDREGRTVTLEFENFYLVNVYVPNSKPKLERLKERVNEFDKKFQQYINELKSKKTVIVLGDLNVAHKEIDLKHPKKNKKKNGFTIEERNSFTNFLELGFIDKWRKMYPEKIKYSWWSNRIKQDTRDKKSGWRIDYCIIDEKSEDIVENVIIRDDVFGSDHCPVEIIVDLSVFEKLEKNKNSEKKKNAEKK